MEKPLDVLNFDNSLQIPSIRNNTPFTLNVFDTYVPQDKDQDRFDYDYTMAEIRFSDGFPVDFAVEILDKVDAFVLATAGTPDADGNPWPEYLFIANKNKADQVLKKQKNAKNTDSVNPDNVYEKLNALTATIDITLFGSQDSKDLQSLREKSAINDKALAKIYPNINDRINFLYSVCCDGEKSHPVCTDIFKQFMLTKLHKAEKTDDLETQNQILIKLMHSLLFLETKLIYKVNQFNTTIGRLKKSVEPYLPCLLDNGTMVNLFDLTNSEKHTIKNCIDVSKINYFYDFSHLCTNSDFVCSRAKSKIVFPHTINGKLDCSYCAEDFITEQTVIPNGTKCLDLTGTIKTMTDLNKLQLPASVKYILFASSTINAILKAPAEIAAFREFAQKHPGVQIWDTKMRFLLSEEHLAPATPQPAAPEKQKTIVEHTPKTPEKTAEWLTRREVLDLCKASGNFNDIDNLDRLIQRAINSNSNIKTEKRIFNGMTVVCVHNDCLGILQSEITRVIDEDARRAKQKEPTQIISTPETPVTPAKAKKAKPKKFEKYISKQVWKDICDSCKDSSQLLYSVLQQINATQVNISEQGISLYINENGTHKMPTSIKTKQGRCIAQSIDDSYANDNRRIVWTINPGDKIIAAIAFFKKHDNTTSEPYANARACAAKGQNLDNKTVNRDLVISNEYLKVSDLLKQYTPKIETNKNTPAQTQEKPKTRRPRIARKNTRATTLVDVKSLDAQIEAFIAHLDTEIKRLAKDTIHNADDAKRQLRNVEEMKKLLQEKISLQKEM